MTTTTWYFNLNQLPDVTYFFCVNKWFVSSNFANLNFIRGKRDQLGDFFCHRVGILKTIWNHLNTIVIHQMFIRYKHNLHHIFQLFVRSRKVYTSYDFIHKVWIFLVSIYSIVFVTFPVFHEFLNKNNIRSLK